MAFSKIKTIISIAASSAVLLAASVSPSYAESLPDTNKFDQYRKSIIQDEIQLATNSTSKNNVSAISKLQSTIDMLEAAEIVELNFNEEGALVTAESSQDGAVTDRFIKESVFVSNDVNNDVYSGDIVQEDETIGLQSIISNPSTPPAGAETGAFHRIQTPSSNSLANSYTGVVADSITLPDYDINAALTSPTEAAYLYTGIDPGIAEVGLTTTRQTGLNMPAGWYPVFHAKATHEVGSGDDNGNGNSVTYYYDSAHRYSGGASVSYYKVYYKYDESYLSVRYILGSQIYLINFKSTSPKGLSVKRLTTIAMNGVTNNKQKFRVPFKTYAVWNNMKFMYNNGSLTKYPSEISGLKKETWNHGGTLDYIKSGTKESIKIY